MQLLDENWNIVANDWTEVDAGTGTATVTIIVPADTTIGEGYFWQGILYDSVWNGLLQDYLYDVTIGPSQSSQFDVDGLSLTLASGQTHSITADYSAASAGTVQLNLLDSSGNTVAGDSASVTAGAGSSTFSIEIPASESGNDYVWQAIIQANNGSEQFNEQSANVTLSSPPTGPASEDPLPPGNWEIDWRDEFSGDAFTVPSQWYPFLGTNPDEFAANEERGHGANVQRSRSTLARRRRQFDSSSCLR